MKLSLQILLLASMLGSAVQAQTIRYVKEGGTGTGSTWTDATGDLQSMINASQPNDQVWVAGGVYKPTPTNDRTISFSMRADVAIYGGFAGTEASLTQRPTVDPTTGHPSSTTLSGDIGVAGDSTDNSYHVIYNPASLSLASSAVLDGFVITGGNAKESYPNNNGAGMFNDAAYSTCSPTLTNCMFQNNTASAGGAMYNYGYFGTSNPTLTNCSFQNNMANNGGAMYNDGSNGTCNPTLTNCSFLHNTASNYGLTDSQDVSGGAMVNYISSPTLTNCSFQHNTALCYILDSSQQSSSAGGAMVSNSGSPTLINCSFVGNTTSGGNYNRGGAMSNTASRATLIDCSFRNNTASGGSLNRGGAMYNSFREQLTNCSFQNNSVSGSGTNLGGAIYYAPALPANLPQLTACSFQGNTASGGTQNFGGAIYIYSRLQLTNCSFETNAVLGGEQNFGGAIYSNGFRSRPQLTNCLFRRNTASGTNAGSGYGGAMYNTGTPALTNCSFQANLATVGRAIYNDVTTDAGNATLTNCVLFDNGGGNAIFNLSGANTSASYSLFEDGETDFTDNGNNLTGVTVSPFASTTGAQLSACSPAINAGDPNTTTATVGTTDLAGNPRFFNNGVVDMGAYEYQANPTVIAITNPSTTTATVNSPFSQTFTASNGQTPYSFSLASGTLPAGLSLSTSGVLSGTPTQSGSFSITVQAIDANGCSGIDNVYVLTVVDPTPTISGFGVNPNPVCSGNPVSFTATIGNITNSYSYTLSNGTAPLTGSSSNPAFSQSLTASGTGLQTYTLTVSSAGQLATATTTLTVNETPLPPSLSLPTSGSCGSPLSVTATCATGTVSWQASGGVANGNVYTVSQPGTYTITAICVSPASCSSSAASPVVLRVLQPFTISQPPASQTACVGSTVTFSVRATPSTGVTYAWYKNSADPFQPVQATTADYTVSVTDGSKAGRYIVVVKGGECSQSEQREANLTVNQRPVPPPPLSGMPQLCPSTSPVNLGQYVSRTNASYTVRYFNGNGQLLPSPNVVLSQPGSYPYTATQLDPATGCESLPTAFTVTVNPTTRIVSGSTSQTACSGSNVVLSVVAEGSNLKYEWFKGSISNVNKLADNLTKQTGTATASLTLVKVSSSENYYVRVTGDCGVVSSAAIRVTVRNCGARIGTEESEPALAVTVLGNPTSARTVPVVVTGGGGQWLRFVVRDVRGSLVSEAVVEEASASHHQEVSLGAVSGLYLLEVSSPAQRQTVKIIRQ